MSAVLLLLMSATVGAESYTWIVASTFPNRSATPLEACKGLAQSMADTTSGYVYPWIINGVLLWDSQANGLSDGHATCCVDYTRAGQRYPCTGISSFNASVYIEGDGCLPGQIINDASAGCADIESDSRMTCLVPQANIVTGKSQLNEEDLVGPTGLALKRYFQTGRPNSGWQWEYSQALDIASVQFPASDDTHMVMLNRPNGGSSYFVGSLNNGFRSSNNSSPELDMIADAQGHPASWRIRYPNGVTETYSADGQLESIADESGHLFQVEHNEAGEVSDVRGEAGEFIHFSYAANGNVVEAEDASGRVWKYIYGAYGELATVILPDETPSDDSDNPRRSYFYQNVDSESGQPMLLLTSVVDERGVVAQSYEYDDTSRLIAINNAVSGESKAIQYQDTYTRLLTSGAGQQSQVHFNVNNGTAEIQEIVGDVCDCAL